MSHTCLWPPAQATRCVWSSGCKAPTNVPQHLSFRFKSGGPQNGPPLKQPQKGILEKDKPREDLFKLPRSIRGSTQPHEAFSGFARMDQSNLSISSKTQGPGSLRFIPICVGFMGKGFWASCEAGLSHCVLLGPSFSGSLMMPPSPRDGIHERCNRTLTLLVQRLLRLSF